MTQPIDQFVSVILPLRNAADSLTACLESLLNQTYTDFEIIAIDDASSDQTYRILRQFRRRDKRLIIRRNVKRYGPTVTLNRALRKARGSYIAFMGGRDISTPDRLKRQVHYLKRHPKIAALGTQTIFQSSDRKPLDKSSFPTDHETITKTFLTSDALQLESVMINKYLLPRDLLKFDDQKHPLLYRSLLAKILPYGMFANLNLHLYIRTLGNNQIEGMTTRARRHVTLWAKARFLDGTGISWNSLLYPLNNKIKSAI